MDAVIDGLSIHYRVHGRGRPVLLIHGFPLSGELWTPAVDLLGENHQWIVPDLRGHGRSQASDRASMQRYADDLAALLDEIGVDRPVVLVGMSMGGYIAFEFCRRHPERVGALVLVDTRAQPDTAEEVRARLEAAERAEGEGSGAIAGPLLEKLFAPGTPAELRERWGETMAATPARGIAAALRAMADRPDSTETLRSFHGPVLVVVGAEDQITPPEEARGMHGAAPRSRLAVIPDAGHMAPVEQPARFAGVLREFLGEL